MWKPHDTATRLFFILLFFFFWNMLSVNVGTWSIPSPISAGLALLRLLSDPLTVYYVVITLLRICISLALSCAIGIPFGIIDRYFKIGRKLTETIFFPIFQYVPSICWVLILIPLFGLSELSTILTLAAVLIPYFYIGTVEGLKNVNKEYVEVAETFTTKSFLIFQKAIFPQIFPYIFSSFRIAFGVGWKVAILAELFCSTIGVGYRLNLAYVQLRVPEVYALVILIIAVSILTERVLFPLIQGRLKWARK